MKRTLLATLIVASLCTPALANDVAALSTEARDVAKSFVQQLGGELKKELESNGAAAGIKTCKEAAPSISANMSRQKGWSVRRVSLKTRNPALGLPDAWEQKALQDFDSRVAKGEKADGMEFAEVVTEPQGKFFRFVKAIPTQAACLKCHGDPATLSGDVKEQLGSNYPHDKATGYSENQVRGAITIKRPL